MLKGKHILLGVTGGIAAYKSAVLARLLVKEGAEVKVIMTEMAKQFITPLTMATLTRNPISVDFYNPENGDWNSHVNLGLWADLYLIAPATANTLGKMAAGVADNLLLTAYLSAKCPVAVAPAMDLDMYRHPAVRQNLELLKRRGVTVIEAASGALASGLDGKGRMEEPERIVPVVAELLSRDGSMARKRVLITGGPTCEALDPVRYITNRSSGKMAYRLAEEAAGRGAEVVLISGPVSPEVSAFAACHPRIRIIPAVSADEMFARVRESLPESDAVILCAAVADFKAARPADRKIKREKENCTLELVPTQDIAAWAGSFRGDKKTVSVGFALETHDARGHAAAKLEKKNLDMIVLNSMEDAGAGFGGDTNKVSFLFRNGETADFPLKSKAGVAADILDAVEKLWECSRS